MKNSMMLNALFFILLMAALSSGQTMRWMYEYVWYGYDEAISIVYSSDNTICVAGNSWDPETSMDIMLVGLDTLGNVLWGPIFTMTMYIDMVQDMICGSNDVLYLCGSIDCNDNFPSPDEDFWVSAVTSTGNPLWTYSLSPSGLRRANSLAQGHDDNIYACGYFVVFDLFPLTVDPDFYVVSLTNSGSLRWAYKFDNAGNQERRDCAFSITYGGDNNIYVAGYISSDTAADQYKDFAVMKLTTSGTQQGIYLYNGPGNNEDEARSIISYGAKLFVAGSSIGVGTNRDFTVICIDTLTQAQWIYRYNGPTNGNDEAYKIISGDDGNLYAGGYSGDDFIIISLDTLGNERWIYRKTGGAAKSLAYGQNRIYACDAGGFGVVCLDTLGNELWCYTYGGQAHDIVYGLDNNIYTAGEDGGFLVISLSDTTTVVGVEEKIPSFLQNEKLDLIIVTLVKNNLRFLISSPDVDNVTLTIYNPIGQRIFARKIDVSSGITKYLTLPQNLPCGTYFLKAEISNRTTVKKFVLVR